MDENMQSGRTSKGSVEDLTSYPGASRPLTQLDKIRNSLDTDHLTNYPSSNHDIKAKRQITSGSEDRFKLDWIDCRNNNSEIKRNNSSEELRRDSKLDQNIRKGRLIVADLSKEQRSFTHKNLHNMDSSQQYSSQQSKRDDSSVITIDQLIDVDSTSRDLHELDLDGQLIDGTIGSKPTVPNDLNHLDEPILDTLLRDLSGIYHKMRIVTLPLSSYDIYKVVLRGWDLWGPLLLCTFLAFNLHHAELDNHTGPHFAEVFVLVWFGSCIVSLNYRLLCVSSPDRRLIPTKSNTADYNLRTSGSDNSGTDQVTKAGDPTMDYPNIALSPYELPFQNLIAPPSILQLMCVLGYCLVGPSLGVLILKLIAFDNLLLERIIIGLIFGFVWPTLCSIRILMRYQNPDKMALAIYPIGFFYFVISCMIILNH